MVECLDPECVAIHGLFGYDQVGDMLCWRDSSQRRRAVSSACPSLTTFITTLSTVTTTALSIFTDTALIRPQPPRHNHSIDQTTTTTLHPPLNGPRGQMLPMLTLILRLRWRKLRKLRSRRLPSHRIVMSASMARSLT